jgi:hypothetical protein
MWRATKNLVMLDLIGEIEDPCSEQRRPGAQRSLGVSFAFPPVEDWFHPSAAWLRRAGLCATQFSRLSFAFFPRFEYVSPSLARLDLARNLA